MRRKHFKGICTNIFITRYKKSWFIKLKKKKQVTITIIIEHKKGIFDALM